MASATGRHGVHIRIYTVSEVSGINIGTGIKVPVTISISPQQAGLDEAKAGEGFWSGYMLAAVIALVISIMLLGIVAGKRKHR